MGKKITWNTIKPNTIFVMEFAEDEAIVCILRSSTAGKTRWDLLERLLEGEKFPYLSDQNDRYNLKEDFCEKNGKTITGFRTLTDIERNEWRHYIELAIRRANNDHDITQQLESLIELLA